MENTGGPGVERELAAAQNQGDIPADTFAARLILARHHAGRLSQREAAERCGLNYASWSNWEDGRRPRDLLDVVQQIADGLDINREWLLFGGPLLPAKGRLTKRMRRLNPGSVQWPVRPADTRPIGRPLNASPAQVTRRPRIVDRTQQVAV